MTADETRLTPGDRRDLRSVVKQQMNVLRAEVEQRKAELNAQVSTRLAERYSAEDARANEFHRKLAGITDTANTAVREIMDEYDSLVEDGRWSGRPFFNMPVISRKPGDRDELRRAMEHGIQAQAKQALLDLDREEASLLRELALDGLRTEAARQFLSRIPTVAQLVPSSRLREIESAFDAARGSTDD